jgi:hypothetical protein
MEKLGFENTHQLIEFATRYTCFENFTLHPAFVERCYCPHCGKSLTHTRELPELSPARGSSGHAANS